LSLRPTSLAHRGRRPPRTHTRANRWGGRPPGR
jgi:hypothetical protein